MNWKMKVASEIKLKIIYKMNTYLLLIPKEITGIIFSYLNSITRNELLHLPEFQFIKEDNYFWYLQTSYDFPQYFISNAVEDWKNIYYGITFLLNPKINPGDFGYSQIREETTVNRIPNLLYSYLNYNDQVKEKVREITRELGITLNPYKFLGHIVSKFMKVLYKKYPNTFRYLIKYNLIKDKNGNIHPTELNKWILISDDPQLLPYIQTRDKVELFDFNEIKRNIFILARS